MNEKRPMPSVWLIAVITLLAMGLLVVIFWDFVSTIIILPVYSFAILLVYGINSVSQSIYLFLLIAIAGVGVLYVLGTTFSKDQLPEYFSPMQYGMEVVSRYRYWQIHCRNLDRNDFGNEEFVRATRKLLLEVLAYEEHRDVFETEMMVFREELDLPEEVQRLITQRRLLNASSISRNWFQRQWRRTLHFFNHNTHTPTAEVINEVEVIINFLEQRLEISYDD